MSGLAQRGSDPEYLDSPYLTLAINRGSALGGFVGLWTVIYLIADLHRGFAGYWWLIAILIIDVGTTVALRVIRARRRARDPDDGREARPGIALHPPCQHIGVARHQR